MGSEPIMTEIRDGVGTICFHRPDVFNAVNLEMMAALETCLSAWRDDDAVRVIVLKGANGTFVSGGDVEQFHAFKTKEAVLPVLRRMGGVLDQLSGIGKPTIAMINGYAIGGGCEIASACDFRFAAADAKLGFVQIGIGITTGWGGGTRLIRMLGRANALRMLLTGERMKADKAHSLGFVDEVFPGDALEQETMRFALQLAAQHPGVVRSYIQLANNIEADENTYSNVAREIERCAELWEQDEHHRAVAAFLERTRK